jgi:predicted dehydrogenase
VKILIAGYGTVGKIRHHEVKKFPDVEVIGICDQNYPQEGSFQNGIPTFNTIQEMMEKMGKNADAIFIALPNYLAAAATSLAIESKLHVFCEKPPSRNVQELKTVLSTYKNHRKQVLMYGFNHRFHPSISKAKEIISSGEFGDLIDIRGIYGKSAIIKYSPEEWRSQRRFSGGGILLDQGIHMVDMFRYMGGEFKVLHSKVNNSHWNYDVEDNAYALLKNESGVVGSIQSSATQWRHKFSLDVTLTEGALTLSGILSSTKSYGAETITLIYPQAKQPGNPSEITFKYSDDQSWADEVKLFITECNKEATEAFTNSQDALQTMELVYAIYDSDLEWKSKYGADWS